MNTRFCLLGLLIVAFLLLSSIIHVPLPQFSDTLNQFAKFVVSLLSMSLTLFRLKVFTRWFKLKLCLIMVLRSTLVKSIKNKCYLNGQCFLFQTAAVNCNPGEFGQHPCSLDKSVCHQNVEKEANLILSFASIPPPPHGAADRADTGGGDWPRISSGDASWYVPVTVRDAHMKCEWLNVFDSGEKWVSYWKVDAEMINELSWEEIALVLLLLIWIVLYMAFREVPMTALWTLDFTGLLSWIEIWIYYRFIDT